MLKRNDHIHWGEFASEAVLPNVSGSPNVVNNLQLGDLAFVTGDSNFQCTSPTSGAAVWTSIGSGAGTDTNAVHLTVADEFDTADEKTDPVPNDRLLIEDSEDTLDKKYVTVGNLSVGANTIHDNIAAEINAIASATPTNSDVILIEDADNSYNKKKATIQSLPVIHDNVNGEINAVTEKETPVGDDWILVEDSEASNAKKKVKIINLSVGANAFHKTIDGEINGLDSKVTPVNNDVLLIEDSADTYGKKKILISALPNVNDPFAIHDNEAGEIAAVAAKETPVANDYLLIEDSEDTNAKKTVTIGDLPGRDGIDSSAIHDDEASEISAVVSKGSPVGADFILIEDSEAGNIKKRITISSLPATLDDDAIHDNVAGEINSIASEQTTLATDDLFLIEDGTTLAKKKLQATNLKDFDAIHKAGTGEIAGLTEELSPEDDDVLVIEDVSNSNVKRKVQLSNLPGTGGGGGDSVVALDVSTTMGTVAFEEVIGQTTYDGSSGASHTFKAIVEPDVAATCEIRLYDRGPVAGPAEEAKLVSKLTTSTVGLQVLSETLTASGSPTFPDNNEMHNTDRMYEVRAYISGSEGDTLYAGKVTLAGA